MTIEFFIPHAVVPKGNSKGIRRIGKFVRLVENEASLTCAGLLIFECAKHKPERPIESFVAVRYSFQFSWTKALLRKKERSLIDDRYPCAGRSDLGNLEKQLDDALERARILKNDRQIVRRQSEKVYADSPGVQVRIEELTGSSAV